MTFSTGQMAPLARLATGGRDGKVRVRMALSGLTCHLANPAWRRGSWLRLAGRGHGVQAGRGTPGGVLVEQKRNRVADSPGGQA